MNFTKTILCLFLFGVIFVCADSVTAQTKDTCPEIKHLDFFGISENEDIEWSDKEIGELLKKDFSHNEYATSFLIPPMIFQLKNLFPACKRATADNSRFDNLVELYFKIRHKDLSVLKDKTTIEQFNYIREDFYEQLKDKRFLAEMRYTMDDGPLFGEIPKQIPESKSSETITTDFGKLSIIKADKQIFLVAADKQEKRIWARTLKGANPERYLTNLEYDKGNLEKTSLATIYYFYSEGERLSLYLEPNGEFMYYFHSW